MKLMLYVLGLLAGSVAFADNHESYSGINLQEGNALQMNLCSLNPGKTMANYDRVFNSYLEWSKENDVEVFVLRATPMFGGPAFDGPQFEFIDMLISPFSVSGDAWTKWLGTEDGQKIAEQWLDTADCRVIVNAAYIQVLDQEALSATDNRVMTINHCTINDGVTPAQMQARHQQMASNWTTDSPIKAWTVMFPALGSRNPIGDFTHMLSFEDANGLMAWQNQMANNEGWRQRLDYETSYADCVGDNVYSAQVLNRPGS